MKKVLIITYYWPPAGGPGVQRWLKFSKYLRDFGIDPVIYTAENPTYPIIDKSLLAEVPEDLEVIKQPIFEPYSIASILSKKNTETISSGIISEEKKQTFIQKVMLYIRGNFFIPDARKFWVRPSIKFLSNHLSENRYDAIITTGPPHSIHLIGLGLKKATEIPWLADFRDPWTSIGYHEKLRLTAQSQQKHKYLEQQVLQNCDQVITTSPTTQMDFKKITKNPVACITNGFEHYGDLTIKQDEHFTLSHIGSLLEERNPIILWKVLRDLKSQDNKFSDRLKIKLAGRVSESVVASIKKYGLKENLELLGYIDHPTALKMQRNAQILLLIEINREETKAIIPGKIFEYLAARRPILAIGPQQADFFDIVSQSNSGKCFTYDDEALLKEQILNWFKMYKNDGIKDITGDISKFTRENLTGELAKLIRKLV